MKQTRLPLALILAWFALAFVHATHAADAPWKWQSALVPDAGFDLDQAQVIRVTTLASGGAGSLREALREKGPRIVVFEVGGVIDLEKQGLDSIEPQVIIAGQTAPAPGITLIKGGLRVQGSQTVVQHLSVRPGDANEPPNDKWHPDGISTAGGPVDVWFDHCSTTWGVDENLSVATYYKGPTGPPARRLHIRNCIIAEGLDSAKHSKGTLVLFHTHDVAIVGNLYSSNVERNPVFQPDTSGVVVNNVIANPGQRAIHAGVPDGEHASLPKARISVVGNVVLFGRKTKKIAAVFEGVADGYFKDNEGFNWRGDPIPLLRVPFDTLPVPPVWPEGLEAVSASAAMWHVARFVGARPAQRDTVDRRIVHEALTGTANIVSSQSDVGGYPKYAPAKRPLDVPEKKRAAWLEKLARDVTFGVEPAKPAEPKAP